MSKAMYGYVLSHGNDGNAIAGVPRLSEVTMDLLRMLNGKLLPQSGTIGRSTSTTISLPFDGTSRKHGEYVLTEEGVSVTVNPTKLKPDDPTGNLNPTYVNGRKVELLNFHVNPGDIVAFGGGGVMFVRIMPEEGGSQTLNLPTLNAAKDDGEDGVELVGVQ